MPSPRLASLLMSFLALSPSAIGLEEPTNDTIEAAQKAAVAAHPKKPYQRRMKKPTARRMRWRRFRYEMGLRAKAFGGSTKEGKRKERWIAMQEIEGAR